jgi:hypothetical protein
VTRSQSLARYSPGGLRPRRTPLTRSLAPTRLR